MCGRYYIASEDSDEQLRQLIDELNRREDREKAQFKTGEVFPGDNALVVCLNKKLVSRPFVMQWGFTGGDGGLLINARSESAHQKPMFRDLVQFRRALIYANGYYEWEKNGKAKTKYALSTEDNFLFLAGLYRPKAYESGHEFVILTKDAAPGIQFIHHRMPVAFSAREAQAWLNPDNDYERIVRDSIDTFYYSKAEGM
ncbi:MAG: SOS response-associated peptidase [Clostridia bacterium]|nr:SOS response-associated peptidase [Clostridia bacterium]